MTYSEFFQKFYISRSEGMLLGFKSQKKIAEFFMKYGMKEEHWDVLPTSENTYEKWYHGTNSGTGRNPRNIWPVLNNHFDSDLMLKKLMKELNESKLRELLCRFDIFLEKQDVLEKRRFANALAAQFKAIAAGNGSAENIVQVEYRKTTKETGYDNYIYKARSKYLWMRLPGEDEQPLSRYFVANNIGVSPVVFPHRAKGSVIKDASLEKLRRFDARQETPHILLIGACGYGKTLMLQHLFIDGVAQYETTGHIPVFAELRHFNEDCNDLLDYILESIQEFDLAWTYEMTVDLLKKGKMQILLDGLDEMDPLETSHFQKALAELCQRYPNNQVVITSRQCLALVGIRRFVKLYIHPLEDEQAQTLIDNLLLDVDDEDAKDTIMSFIGTNFGFVRRNGFIATNPMLLTIIVQHYWELKRLNGSRVRFYELLYRVLIKGHDEEKESFGRFFHSVGSSDEFTDVFREFCASSYLNGVFEFDNRSFELYFKQLKSKDQLNNPSRFTLTNFQHDVCSTACMMYEQESGIYYIDPGFQFYFFAEFFYQQDTSTTKAMGRELWDSCSSSLLNPDALVMFYEIAKEKVETCVLLPYLDSIFKEKTDEESFLRFLSSGYGDISYVLLDDEQIKKLGGTNIKTENMGLVRKRNFPRNVIMQLLVNLLHLPEELHVGKVRDNVLMDKNTTHFIAGLNGYFFDSGEEVKVSMLSALPIDEKHLSEATDESQTIYGYVYNVNPLSLLDERNKRLEFLATCAKGDAWMAYSAVKLFHDGLLTKQKENGYR